MGMFDYVIYECPCPHCGRTLKDFQSKSGPCLLLELQPKQVVNFYTWCENCKNQVEFRVKVTAYELELVQNEQPKVIVEGENN